MDSSSATGLQHKESDNLDDLEGFDDFTIASSWERFIAGMEVVCREWQAASISQLLAAGAEKVEGLPNLRQVHKELAYGSKTFRADFFFHSTMESDSGEEWADGVHPLELWFGVTNFVILSPISMSGVVLDAPEATLLLSTVAVALSNCGSELPAFVPVHDPTRKAYQGIQGTKTYSARYETDRIGSWVPVRFMHLEGLHDLFVSKVAFKTAGAIAVPNFEVEFTMRLTYRTPMPGFEYLETGNAEPIANFDGDMADDIAWDEDCPWAEWHSVEDPVKGFELITTWTKRKVRNSMEMAEYENLSTLEADNWLLTLVTAKDQGNVQQEDAGFAGRLRALVHTFHVSCEAEFLEDFAAADKPGIQHVTQSLTVPPPTVLDRILKDLFQSAPLTSGNGGMDHQYADGVKGAPPDSLFARFCLHALRFGTCNIRAIAVLWIEFVREVRWCWDEEQPLPRVSPDAPPDFTACLLHQKLQLLAVCITHRAARPHVADDITAGPQQEDGKEGSFEVGATDLQALEAPVVNTPKTQSPQKHSTGAGSPQEDTQHERLSASLTLPITEPLGLNGEERRGSNGPVGNLMLLNVSQSLHAPITQKPPIMTEDMLQEREQALATLHKSPSQKMARARLQSEILASDMAAFKAANPGAVLEDFVRWHSPRDWLDTVGLPDGEIAQSSTSGHDQAGSSGRGKLSERMSKPGNSWARIWDSVDACAAADQKPLFDHTREGEKVMHYLDTVRPQQLLAQMLSTAFLVAADALKRTVTDYMIQPVKWELDELFASMSSVLPSLDMLKKSDEHTPEGMVDWHNDLLRLCAVFERVEANVIFTSSLVKKLQGAPRLLAAFLNQRLEPTRFPPARVPVGAVSTPGQWKEGGQMEAANEREVVASLFSPLNQTQTWRKSIRMGNFLNGHEPLVREVIFWCCNQSTNVYQHRDRKQRAGSHRDKQMLYSHRMYISGTSNDLQVAFSVVSTD